MSQVLVVEDDHIAAQQYKVALENRRHKVVITDNGRDCLTTYIEQFFDRTLSLELPIKHPYDTVIIDYKMPGIDGARIAMAILSLNPKQRILFATAYMSELMVHFKEIANMGRYVEILPKPFDKNVLIDVIEDRQVLEELAALGVDVDALLLAGATHDELLSMLESLKSGRSRGN